MSRRIDWARSAPVFQQSPNILAAWAFGSAKDGEARPGSDADIGVFFDHKPTLDELASLRADLQLALDFEDIDLVPLNDASPILCFEAISGAGLFCRDAERRAGFVSLTAREYEDAMALLEWGLANR